MIGNKPKYEDLREIRVTVGGIIRYLPENSKNPLWNYDNWDTSYDLSCCTLIMSSNLVNEITRIYGEIALNDYSLSQSSETSPYDGIAVLCSGEVTEGTEGGLTNLAELYGLTCNIDKGGIGLDLLQWKAEYGAALDSAMLDAVIAIAGSFAVICLLLQLVTDRLEEDRKHIGIFQALGVRQKDIAGLYIRRGLGNGVLAILAGNGALALAARLINRASSEMAFPGYYISGKGGASYINFGDGPDWIG